MRLRVATRASLLALTQTRWVCAELKARTPGLEVEEVVVSTQGDRVTDRPLASIGGKGLFVAEVQAALLRDEADFAVHSLKDVPGDTLPPPGLSIASTPKREDARDVLITTDGIDLGSLRRGARIGTTSLRRTVQLKARRPDLVFATLRGNVGTRLRKLREGNFDAIVLAAAGLGRLELLDEVPHWALPPETCLPAVGQGALALEAHDDKEEVIALLRQIEDASARVEVEAERTMLELLRGNCHSPIAGYARLEADGSRLSMDAMVASSDGDRVLNATADRYLRGDSGIDAARKLGEEVAENLLSQGARKLIEQAEVSAFQDRLTSN